uniref:Uncharacterized protein n=1 Tax=Thermogemmatispora argillosa TaxID=2045280 RepID=A0A455SY44_9CHLR|nr:hypothetical protein KTA_15520 [Thermogemmatispora argillosa]
MWSVHPDGERLPGPHVNYNGHMSLGHGGSQGTFLRAATEPGWSSPAAPTNPGRRRAGRRLLWASLAVGLLLALLVGSAVYYLYGLRSTPEKTLSAFCSALSRHDSRAAYQYLDPALQRQTPFLVFAGLLEKTEHCGYGTLGTQGPVATAKLQLTVAGQVQTWQVKLSEQDGIWLIAEDAALTALPRSLSSFCTMLRTGQAEAAYGSLTPLLQSHVARGVFRLLVDGITACSAQLVAVDSTQAKALVVVSYRNEAQPEQNTALLVPAGGRWLIDALSSLSTPTRSLLSFCRALQEGDYAAAYALLSLDFQAHFGGQRQFVAVVDPVIKSNGGIKSCAAGAVQQKGERFVVNGVITYANGKVETDRDELVLEADIWRLASIA